MEATPEKETQTPTALEQEAEGGGRPGPDS